ncbi:uncharacterized protein LOC141826082 [Curcuma longa]|uniref:uncharacterized protein LOC141826082 n=1 Tax=Curcuma longa TaxID=136217 RepID=UPI003D9E39E6
MGCKSSKVDESNLVSLCRKRRDLIAAVVDRQYALAAAHAAYFDALASVGEALHRFVQEELTVASSSLPPGSPLLTVQGKIKSSGLRRTVPASSVSSCPTSLPHALSVDGSHLPLSSIPDSEGDRDRISVPDGKDASATLHRHISFSSPHSSFLKSSIEMPQPIYQEPLPTLWSKSPNNSHEYDYVYPPYGVPVVPGTPAIDEKFGPSGSMVAPATPPPPSPAKASSWEFFDPFASYEHFLPHYSQANLHRGFITSSPDLSEVRKQEGIPDLEFELDAEPKKRVMKENANVMKENIDNKDFGGKQSSGGEMGGKESSIGNMEAVPTKNAETKDEKMDTIWLAEKGRMNSGAYGNQKNGEVKDPKKRMEVIDKKSYATKESVLSGGKSSSSASTGLPFFLHATRDSRDVVRELREHFNSAADCGEEVARMLEVDKLPYHSQSGRFQDISSRILDPIAVSFLTSSLYFNPLPEANTSTVNGKAGENSHTVDVITKSGNLSSTLEKLYLLEEKLYKEIKDEEKLRIIYQKRYRQLKALSDSGADSSKIEITQISVRKLQTEISVVVRSIKSISNRMHKIRDEELQPLLAELVQGLRRMWQSVLDCHQKQLKAIVNSKVHKLVASIGNQRESVAKATKELQLELINWYRCFIDWIFVQKSYVEALNRWLISWLPHEVEQTPDGVAPFSPGKIGAPSVFVLSNDWYHANTHISGKQVIEAMDTFMRILHSLSLTQREEERQRLEAEYMSQLYDKKIVNFMEKGMSGHLEIESVSEDGLQHHNYGTAKLDFVRKRLDEKILKHKEISNQIKKVSSRTLQSGLTPLFMALGSFTSDILREYDNLRIPTEGEETLDKQNLN